MSLITAFRGINEYDDVFVGSLLQRLKLGGHLILREDNVNTKEKNQLVTLFQYVENLQSGLSWKENVEQNRAYRSIEGWQRHLLSQGMTLKQRLPI